MRQPFRAEFVAWGTRSIFGLFFIVTAGQMVRMILMEQRGWEAVLSLLLLAAPLALLFVALDVLVEAAEQHWMTHHLTRRMSAWLRWTPRAGALLFALFMSIFALDVFGMGGGFWATALAFFMHLMPTFIVLALLVVAWRWPWVGGAALLLAAGLFLLRWGPGWGGDWMLYLLFIGTPVAMGLLFLANWWLRGELTDGQHQPALHQLRM